MRFSKFSSLAFGSALLVSGMMFNTSVDANTVGIAVGGIGSTTGVAGGNVGGVGPATPTFRPGTIKYYIPLDDDTDGIYGVDTWDGSSKIVGLNSDKGYGQDDSLTMFLHYKDIGDDFGAPQPLSPGIATFTFEFEDLDLTGLANNDPSWFREAVQISFFESDGSTGYNEIFSSDKISDLGHADSNGANLTVGLASGATSGALPEQLITATLPISGNEVWARLTFSSDTFPNKKGQNTPEYLFPWADVTPVPVPAALPLFLSGLLGLGLVARRRKKSTI